MKKEPTIARTLSIIMIMASICLFAFYVNRDIVIKGLYMDDLYMWSCYGEQSLMEFAFPIGTSTRFRPVYWLATYLQMAIIGTHVDRFVAFNIIINILAAFEILYICLKISGGGLSGLIISAFSSYAYLASRFAYYQIGQALGLMETMALMMALFIMYRLYVFSGLGYKKRLQECRGICCDKGCYKVCDTTYDKAHDKSDDKAHDKSDDKVHDKVHDIKTWDNGRAFYSALIMYFLLAFVHERYISLLPLFYIALIIDWRWSKAKSTLAQSDSGKGSFARWISPLAVFAFIFAIRTLAIGKAIPAGTGGTEVTETFSIAQAIRFCFDQILYIFGVNAGPEYLCGLEWAETPWQIKRLVKVSVLFIGILSIIYIAVLIIEIIDALSHRKTALNDRHAGAEDFRGRGHRVSGCVQCCEDIASDHAQEHGKHTLKSAQVCGYGDMKNVQSLRCMLWDNVSALAIICGFIALCIGCSSVTIRLEMRWIYVSYAAALILAARMAGGIKEAAEYYLGEGWAYVAAALVTVLFTAYAVIAIFTNIFFRGYFDRLYFWPNQLRMNSLAEETVEKYGTEGVFGKHIYIIGNTYGMSDFYAETFFKPYDPDKKAEGTVVSFLDSITEVPAEEVREDTALVLIELPEENAYKDITEDLR